jgi:DNA-binding GntR family transcriptional regulator
MQNYDADTTGCSDDRTLLLDDATGEALMPTGEVGDGQSVTVVYGLLRNAIIQGELAAGTAISQVALEKDYGVGRTPLREALRLLQAEGFVVGEPKKRVRIAELSGADVEELFGLRILLETTAVRLTVPTLTSRDIAEMEGYMAQMDHYGRGRDWLGLREPHRAFHGRFVSGAGPRSQGLILNLFDHAERYRVAEIAPPEAHWAERQAEHRRLVDAAADGDADGTADLLAHHYTRTLRLILSTLEPDRDPVRLREMLERVAPQAGVLLD